MVCFQRMMNLKNKLYVSTDLTSIIPRRRKLPFWLQNRYISWFQELGEELHRADILSFLRTGILELPR